MHPSDSHSQRSPARSSQEERTGGGGELRAASPDTHRCGELEAILRTVPLVLFSFDPNGIITLQEGRALATLGLTPGQRLGEDVRKVYRALPGGLDAIERALRGEEVAWQGRVGDVDLHVALIPEHGPDGALTRVVGVAQDISAQRQAQGALLESEARTRALLDHLPDIVLALVSGDAVTTYVSPSVQWVLGVPPQQIVGHTSLKFVAPEHHDLVLREFAAILSEPGVHRTIEIALVRPDGSLIWVEVSAMNRLHVPEVASIVVAYRDITTKREAEAKLAATRDQLRQSQKMEAIGNLAGGIAHDFNNLLTIIMSCNDYVMTEMAPDDPLRNELQSVADAADRAGQLTRQLLSFSRRQVLQPFVLDPAVAIGRLERLLRRLLGEDILLRFDLDSRGGRVFVDPNQLEQVLINLTVNARDAMPMGGVLTVSCAPRRIDEPRSGLLGMVDAGRYMEIAVTDTGHGMTREIMARIFDPFFTTKEVGRGTGLGLSTVFGIVKQSGGHIEVESAPMKGSTFRILLPETERHALTSGQSRPATDALTGSETVLLVEDNDAVRRTMRDILVRHGYDVLEAANGGEAILIAEQHPRTIDLLVTDMVMPRMSGRTLAERVTLMRPGTRVLFVTGHVVLSEPDPTPVAAHEHFMTKPVTPSALASKVRAVLDEVPETAPA